jgi:hypothetical protein
VRIALNTSTTRALTLEQAQRGIDFYEAVFKHTGDGRVFSASATADKVLAIQLPSGIYDTVLLAGTKTGTLLAWDYLPDQEVNTGTSRITYELKALDVAVNGPTNKVALEILDILNKVIGWDPVELPYPAPGGVTKDGLPYFILSPGRVSTGTITIGNFPDKAIFDTALVDDSKDTTFRDGLTAIVQMAAYDLVRLLGVYEKLTDDAEFLANAAEANEAFVDAAGRDRYIANAAAAEPVLAELADLTDWLATNVWESTFWGVGTALYYSSIQSYKQPAVKPAWGKAYTGFVLTYPSSALYMRNYADRLRNIGRAYTKAAGLSAGKTRYDEDLETEDAIADASSQYGNRNPTIISTSADLQEIFGLINTAITATSGLRLGSAGVGSRPAVIPFAGGYVDFDAGTVEFTLAPPQASGLTKLYFDFPFKPFGSSQANTWHIKEGIDNYVIDDGKGQGGSILLSIGGGGPIIIDSGSTP